MNWVYNFKSSTFPMRENLENLNKWSPAWIQKHLKMW